MSRTRSESNGSLRKLTLKYLYDSPVHYKVDLPSTTPSSSSRTRSSKHDQCEYTLKHIFGPENDACSHSEGVKKFSSNGGTCSALTGPAVCSSKFNHIPYLDHIFRRLNPTPLVISMAVCIMLGIGYYYLPFTSNGATIQTNEMIKPEILNKEDINADENRLPVKKGHELEFRNQGNDVDHLASTLKDNVKLIDVLSSQISSLQEEMVELKRKLATNKEMEHNDKFEKLKQEVLQDMTNKNNLWPKFVAEIAKVKRETIQETSIQTSQSANVLRQHLSEEIRQQVTEEMAKVKIELNDSFSCSQHAEPHSLILKTEKLIEDAIAAHNEAMMKTRDYALESAGGSIYSSKADAFNNVGIYLMGFLVMSMSSNPNNIIQAPMNPSSCWTFSGSTAEVVLKLSTAIFVESFSIEHISKAVIPENSVHHSAPRKFVVYGQKNATSESAFKLGTYQYEKDGESLQYFPVEVTTNTKFQFIRVNFLSNWGNPKFTCVYRFKVHGLTNN